MYCDHHQQNHLLARGKAVRFGSRFAVFRESLVMAKQRQVKNRSIEGRPRGKDRIRTEVFRLLPEKIAAPPNCARIFKRSHCSVTPICTCGSSFRKARSCGPARSAPPVRMAICAVGFCFKREPDRLIQRPGRSSSVGGFPVISLFLVVPWASAWRGTEEQA